MLTGEEKQVADYLERSLKFMKAAASEYERKFVKRADRSVNFYELNHYIDEVKGTAESRKAEKDRTKVPYPYSNTRQIKAEIFSSLPPVIVKTEKRDTANGAQMLREGIMYAVRKSNFEQAVNITALSAVATGVGCTQMLAQENSKIPTYRNVIYRDVLWDFANVLDVYKSPWIACKKVILLDDAKNDESYDETARENINPAKLDVNTYGDLTNEYCVIWEWFDKKNDVFMEFSDGATMPLKVTTLSELFNLKDSDEDFVTDWPFSFFICEEMITTSAGLGNIYPIESLVKELDKTRTQMVVHRKRFNRKYLARKGSLDGSSRNQLKSSEDGTIVEIETLEGQALNSVVAPLIDAPMSADVYNVDRTIQNDIQITGPLGPNSLVRGVGQGPDTLGEAQIVQQSSNTRLGDQQKAFAAYLKRLYRLTGQYLQFYWTDQQEFRTKGDGTNEADYQNWDNQAVQGEYDYDVTPESMKDNSAVYRKQYAEAITFVAPLLAVAKTDPAINMMLRGYIQTFDTLKNMVDTIVPEIQPIAQGANMAGGNDPEQELLDFIQGKSEDEIIAYLDTLPDNEREVIKSKLLELNNSVSVPAQAPTAPSQTSINQSVVTA